MFSMKKRETDVAKGEGRGRDLPVATPPMDVFESDTEFVVVADVPGVPADATNVVLENDHLAFEASAPGRKYRRELVVPTSVDRDAIEATVRAGVLTLRLPKRAPFKPRQIQVRAA